MSVASRNLATGKLTHKVDTGGKLADLELRPNGSFAYITSAGQVRKVDKTGSVLLDPGPGVDPQSLAGSGSIVYWTRAGKPYSASLF